MFKKRIPDNLRKIELEALNANVGRSYCDMNLVGQYGNAIDILINNVIEKKYRVDLISHPLLYLMRHSIELYLKENIRYLSKYSLLELNKKIMSIHSLHKLFNEFEQHFNKIDNDLNFKNEIIEEYKKYANDLNEVIKILGDDWSSFRYVYSTKGKKIFEYNKVVNIYELKKKFDESRIFLTHTADAISPYTDYVDYLKFDENIKLKSLGFVLFCLPDYQKDNLIKHLDHMYDIVEKNKIWFDKDKDYHLHLKIANEQCYAIPIKKEE